MAQLKIILSLFLVGIVIGGSLFISNTFLRQTAQASYIPTNPYAAEQKTTSQGETILEIKSSNLQPYYTQSLKINAKTPQSKAQIPLRINTQELIENGKLDTNCEFLSITLNDQTIPSYVETGCNTPRTVVWVYLETLPADGLSLELQYSSLSAINKPSFKGFYAQELSDINLTNRLSSEVALQATIPETIASSIANAGSNTEDFSGNTAITIDENNLADFIFTDSQSQPLQTPHTSTQETGYTIFSVINNSQPNREVDETILGLERECIGKWCDTLDDRYFGTSAILTKKNEYRETEVAGKNHKTHYREKIRNFPENQRTLVINHTPPGKMTLTYFNQESRHRKRQVLKERSYKTTNLTIGGINDQSDTSFRGGISEVIMTDTALSTDEIQIVREYLMRLYQIQDYKYDISFGEEVSRLDGTIGDNDLTGVPIDEETTLFNITDIDIQNQQITLYNGIDPERSFPSNSLSINTLLVSTTNQTTEQEENELSKADDIQLNLEETNEDSNSQLPADQNELIPSLQDQPESETAPPTPISNETESSPQEDSQADKNQVQNNNLDEEVLTTTAIESASKKVPVSPSKLNVICETDLLAGDSPACDINLTQGDFGDHSGSVEISVEETEGSAQFEFPDQGNSYSVLLDPVFETGNYTLSAILVDDINQTSLSLKQLSVSILKNTTEGDLVITPPTLDSVVAPTIEAAAVVDTSPWNTQNMAILSVLTISLVMVTIGLGVAFTAKSKVQLAPVKQELKPYQQFAYLDSNRPTPPQMQQANQTFQGRGQTSQQNSRSNPAKQNQSTTTSR
jgi:hypothetical protein